jgi:hypothetical protein
MRKNPMRRTVNQSKILVFLPQAAGAVIVSKLAERGYVAVAVSTVPEAFEALRSDQFALAITTRSNIDLVRNICALPAINLEVFFHTSIPSECRLVNTRHFDSRAFMERVRFFTKPVPSKDLGTDQTARSPALEKGAAPWWNLFAIIRRGQRTPRGEAHVRS